MENEQFILGLDVSTKTIGISLFLDNGKSGELKLLHHVTPKVKPKTLTKTQELFEKARIFEKDFLNKYKGIGISRVIIEEPLLGSNNVHTVATLLRFNGMISRSVYETLGVVPEFISSYDARKYAFPELMEIRTLKKNGEPYTAKELKGKKPVLFGAYPQNIDKKNVIWEKVNDLEPAIDWQYRKNFSLKPENYDMTDAYTCVRGFMKKMNFWC